MAVSELEKERYLDMEQVEEIQKDERKEIAIRLKNINISYKTGKDIIHRGDFTAEAGEITAIIGPSGEGKTTLIRVLLGLLYPTEGFAELCNAKKSARLSAGTRSFLSYVPQGNTIFAGTVAENMRMIKKDATDEEIREVLHTQRTNKIFIQCICIICPVFSFTHIFCPAFLFCCCLFSKKSLYFSCFSFVDLIS